MSPFSASCTAFSPRSFWCDKGQYSSLCGYDYWLTWNKMSATSLIQGVSVAGMVMMWVFGVLEGFCINSLSAYIFVKKTCANSTVTDVPSCVKFPCINFEWIFFFAWNMQRQILKPLSSEICMFRIFKEIMHVFNQC